MNLTYLLGLSSLDISSSQLKVTLVDIVGILTLDQLGLAYYVMLFLHQAGWRILHEDVLTLHQLVLLSLHYRHKILRLLVRPRNQPLR